MESTAKPLFDFSDRVRNISIIGSIFHGKTCLKNALVASEPSNHGNYAQSSQLNSNPSYSTNYSSLKVNHKTHPYFISVADTPGHIECLDEVFSALKITDGAIIVVDCIDGPRLQMDVIIKSLLEEQVRPVLFINMIDHAIIEEKISEEDLYNRFDQTIKKLNAIVTKTDPNAPESFKFDPLKGNVIFGSAKNGWTFNLEQFAKLCAKKTNINDHTNILPRMWGDNFYDESKKQFVSHYTSSNGSFLRRFFCKVVLDPLFKILNSVNDSQQDITSIMQILDIKLENDYNKLQGIELAHYVVRKLLSGTDALIGTIIEKLPSPITAQKYRATKLYKHDDTIFQSISQCDAKGPAMVYVSRNVLSADKSNFHMIARVFSGTITTKDKLFIVGIELGKEWNGSEYAQKSKVRTIKKLTTLSGSAIDYCPCGNIVIIEGMNVVDEYNSFTLSSIETANAISQTVSPIVPRLGLIFTINTSDITPYLPALRKVYHCDVRNYVVIEHVDWPALFECHGEFHANTIIDRLKQFIGNPAEYKTDYHIMLRESVTEKSSKMSVAVTPNKHNRFWIKMEPLNDNTMMIIRSLNTNKKITDVTEFVKKFGLDEQTAKNTWYIGPGMIESEWSSNIFTNYTKNVLSIDEQKIQKLMKTGFTNAMQEGALCGEQMTATKTNLHEANVYSRNGYLPIVSAVQRAMKAAQLRAKPILLEPIMKLELIIDHSNTENVKEILIKRRAFNIGEEKLSQIHSIITGFLPAVESIGLTNELSEEFKQLLYPQMLFDHWKVIEGDPLTDGSLANKIMMQVRQRKGMTMEIPKPEDFEDKGYDYYQ